MVLQEWSSNFSSFGSSGTAVRIRILLLQLDHDRRKLYIHKSSRNCALFMFTN